MVVMVVMVIMVVMVPAHIDLFAIEGIPEVLAIIAPRRHVLIALLNLITWNAISITVESRHVVHVVL